MSAGIVIVYILAAIVGLIIITYVALWIVNAVMLLSAMRRFKKARQQRRREWNGWTHPSSPR